MDGVHPGATGQKLLNSIPEAARRLDVSRSYIYMMLARGELEAVKVGAATRITEESLQRRVKSLPAAAFGKRTEAA